MRVGGTRSLVMAACAAVIVTAAPLRAQDPDGHEQHGGHAEHGGQDGHAEHDHSQHQPSMSPDLPPGVPVPTAADRAAAFPDIDVHHAVHDSAIRWFVLVDQLEWQGGSGAPHVAWDSRGWIGGDVNRVWFRTEGEGRDRHVEGAEAHLLYGRAIARWWDLVAGVRQDIEPGPARTWAAIGVRGLAPYWFDVEATAYVGPSARTHVRLETEYELLLTRRLALQPRVELNIFGKHDGERRTGAGLSSAEAGIRLRYEIRREFAPYVGWAWNRLFFGTADEARAAGESVSGSRLAAGVRVWF